MPPIRLPKPPTIKPRVPVKPRAPPRVQPGGPRPSVPTKPNPKAPTVKPKPKPRPTAGGSGGISTAAAAGGVIAAGAAGSFLPSVINQAGGVASAAANVANTAIITDAVKEFGEYLVDNPWALAVIGGVVVIFLIR